MAEQAVKKEIVKKPIKYKRNDNSEEENLKSLVAERDAALKQEEEEKKDVEETESLNPEEKHLKRDMAIYADTLNKKKKSIKKRYLN